MSVINNNGLAPGFAQANGLPAFSPANGSLAVPTPLPFGRTDNIESVPYPGTPQGEDPSAGDGYGQGTGGFGGLYNQLLSSLSSLFSNLGSMFGSTLPPNSAGPGLPGTPSSGRGQTFFASASASSVGDPHESFTGTSGNGAVIDQKWDSMIAHPNLLDSNSFDGGYRVSTGITQPNGHGITQNDSATVTTSGGATTVTMRQDGSYAVESNGRSLSLPVGQAQNLGNGESVTLNADKSLTIVDTNAQGGCISTTLKANGTGGVDVSNTAKNVDLGGSLVGHAEYRAGGIGNGGAQPAQFSGPLENALIAT